MFPSNSVLDKGYLIHCRGPLDLYFKSSDPILVFNVSVHIFRGRENSLSAEGSFPLSVDIYSGYIKISDWIWDFEI